MPYDCPPHRPCHLPVDDLCRALAGVTTASGLHSDLMAEAITRIACLERERDEARREVCQLMRPDEYNEPFDGTVFEYAAHRGWDCFKEAADE